MSKNRHVLSSCTFIPRFVSHEKPFNPLLRSAQSFYMLWHAFLLMIHPIPNPVGFLIKDCSTFGSELSEYQTALKVLVSTSVFCGNHHQSSLAFLSTYSVLLGQRLSACGPLALWLRAQWGWRNSCKTKFDKTVRNCRVNMGKQDQRDPYIVVEKGHMLHMFLRFLVSDFAVLGSDCKFAKQVFVIEFFVFFAALSSFSFTPEMFYCCHMNMFLKICCWGLHLVFPDLVVYFVQRPTKDSLLWIGKIILRRIGKISTMNFGTRTTSCVVGACWGS